MLEELGEMARRRELTDIHTLFDSWSNDKVDGIGLVDGDSDYWFVDGQVEERAGANDYIPKNPTKHSRTAPPGCGVWSVIWMDTIRKYVEVHPFLPSHHILVPFQGPVTTLDRPSGEVSCIAAVHDNPAEDYWYIGTETFPPTVESVQEGPFRESANPDWGTSIIYRYNDPDWSPQVG